MKKKSEKEIRKIYRKNLPHGAISEIAEMANVSQSLVSHFLSGRNSNLKIEYAILRYISKIRKEKNELLIEAGLENLA